MPVHIFIQGDKFSNTRNIVQWIASRTGWPVVTDSDLIRQAAGRFGMQPERIERDLHIPDPVMPRRARRRKRAMAFLEASLAETLRGEAGILWGMAGHLIPRKMPHILRVLVTADAADRIKRASEDRNIPEKEARHQIRANDRLLFQWHHHLFGTESFDAVSYDVVVPSGVLDTEAAALLIFEHLTEKAEAAPVDVETALEDFSLAVNVQMALAEKRDDITASAENGRVTLTIDSNVLRLDSKVRSLKRLVGGMPNVAGVEVKVGRNYHRSDIYRRCRFEMSPGLQFMNLARRRRHLRRSAVSRLPADIGKRPLPNQIGLGRPLNM